MITPVPFNSNSLDFISQNPMAFMHTPYSVYLQGPNLIANWNAGCYSKGVEQVHCPKATLIMRITCEGNMPRISLNAMTWRKASTLSGQRTYSSSWVVPFGYPVLSRIGSASDDLLCPDAVLLHLSHFACYIQEILGYGYSPPADLNYIDTDYSPLIDYLINYDWLEDSDSYSCGVCPGSFAMSNSEEEYDKVRLLFTQSAVSQAEHVARLAIITMIAAGDILSGEIPSRVGIPYGCGTWETFLTDPLGPDRLVIPARQCDTYSFWLPSKGSVCFTVEPPEPDPPGPGTGGPSLPSAASYVNPPVPPPPGADPSPIGWGWSFPGTSPPTAYRYPRHVKAQGFQQAVVGCGYAPNPLNFTSNCFYMYNDDDLKLVVKPYNCGSSPTIYDTSFFLRQYKVDAAGWAVKTDNWKFCGGDWFHHTQYTKEPTQFPAILPCQGTCYKWRVEVILTSNGNPPYPGGMTIRNYIDVVCSIAPHIEKEDGVAYLYSGTNVLGPLGWAASMYLWFDVSLGTKTCLP